LINLGNLLALANVLLANNGEILGLYRRAVCSDGQSQSTNLAHEPRCGTIIRLCCLGRCRLTGPHVKPAQGMMSEQQLFDQQLLDRIDRVACLTQKAIPVCL